MVRLNWTEQAANDLKNIFEYISKDSKIYAKQHIERIRSKTILLRANPYIGRKVPEFNDKNIREILFGNFRIIYKISNEETIDILTVFHASRILKLI